ncbi:MAG TPA: M14 family metallopeptidase [Thermomicrobiaceae bacterium]|nr:M14 family metallopeptidase [Thermomicrobiaceae bacterium]
MTGTGPDQRIDGLYGIGQLLADRNGDGFVDDLRTRIVLDGEPDAELWAALLDLAARLGVETAGLSLPLVDDDPSPDTLPIVVRPGDAERPEYRADGWHGRAAVVIEGAAAALAMARGGSGTPGQGPSRPAPPERLDLAGLFETDGLLVDADGDGAPDGTRLCVLIPADLPPAVGRALVDLAARLGMESGGVDLPIATTGTPPAGTVPLRLDVRSGDSARLSVREQPGGAALEAAGDPGALASLLGLLAREWPALPGGPDASESVAWLRRTLAGWTPEGRAAALRADLEAVPAVPDGGAVRLLDDDPDERAGLAVLVEEILGTGVDVLGPGATGVVFRQEWSARWEGDRALDALREQVLPALDPRRPLELTLLVSEPPEQRRRLDRAVRQTLAHAGFAADGVRVHVLDAFKAGLGWLREVVLPEWLGLVGIDRVVLHFLPLVPEPGLHALDMRIRWLQELFPGDEVMAAALGLPLDRFSLEEWDGPATYAAEALDAGGRSLARAEFSPLWYTRPYVGPYPDAGTVHVSTGGILARQGNTTVEVAVPTDLDVFWDYYQGEVLPRLRTYIVEQADGRPAAADQPFFDELRVEVSVSESDEPYGLREERHSAAEALHEDIYFNTLDFVEVLGQRLSGERLVAPGPVVPVVHVRPGLAPAARVSLRARARAVGRLELGGLSRPIGTVARDLPPAAGITAVAGDEGWLELTVSLPEADAHTRHVLAALGTVAPPEEGRPALAVQAGAEQVMVAAPLPDALPEVEPAPLPTPSDTILTEENLLSQLARLTDRPEVTVRLAERSYQGRPIPAVEVVAPMAAAVWSPRKLALQKPTFLVVGRHHANEVASTTAALWLVERLVDDPFWRPLLDRVNVALLPYENADGAALHAWLQHEHPIWKHHPARYNAVGFEFGEDQHNPDSPYGEARARAALWRRWLPDVVVDNHGVPSHEWAQVFAGFGSPPRFGVSYWQLQALIYGILHYLDDPAYPAHRDAALALREAVARAVAEDPELLALNRTYYERYVTWGHRWVPERFPAGRHGEMVWHFGPVAADAPRLRRAFTARAPQLTVVSWVTEVGDETAHDGQLERTARAHLVANRATLDLLAAAATPVERRFLGTPDGVRVTVARARPIRLTAPAEA